MIECPKCKANGSSIETIEVGKTRIHRMQQRSGKLEPHVWTDYEPLHVKAKCYQCSYVWKLRGKISTAEFEIEQNA